jgi:hypothetical protein
MSRNTFEFTEFIGALGGVFSLWITIVKFIFGDFI